MASWSRNAITGKRVKRAGKGQGDGLLLLLVLFLLMKVLEKGDRRAGRGYKDMDHMDKDI